MAADDRSIQLRTVPAAEMEFVLTRYPQVERLFGIHEMLGGTGPGRRHNLEVLNKSAIVLACAVWEAFCEEIAADALDHLAEHAPNGEALPGELRASVAREIAKEKHEHAAWKLADDGWRDVLRERANKLANPDDRTLSSPSSDRVRDFFQEQVGISGVIQGWHWPHHPHARSAKKLDAFVHLRNVIAHKSGPPSGTVTLNVARSGVALIRRLSELTISHLDMRLSEATGKPFIEETTVKLP